MHDLAVSIINGQGAQILFMQLYLIGHSAGSYFSAPRCLFGDQTQEPLLSQPEKACEPPAAKCYEAPDLP